MEELVVVPLHKHPEYIKECCRILNDEWKRSETARLRTVENSCDTLPTSLILLQNKKIIGHLKLTTMYMKNEAVFLKSVVIDKSVRGKGYGSFLMKKSEEYCRNFLKKSVVYLSTHGQERFYSKLGYTECCPVSIYGGAVYNEIKPRVIRIPIIFSVEKVKCEDSSVVKGPPPPPMPNNIDNNKSGITFMKKKL